jgi:glucokinase
MANERNDMVTLENDARTVLTLDAGGTNFVFSAMQGLKEIAEPVRLQAHPNDLDKSLDTLVSGFRQVMNRLETKPAAISFAFPGPADYPNGIIDNVGNLPAFGGGVALKDFLEEQFQLPVFINNDGDLFACGEAIAGFLPKVNRMLEEAGSAKRYSKLFGVTIGTGFGGGLVADGRLYIGDNSAAGEIWITRNKRRPNSFAEEGVSIRAVRGSYARLAGLTLEEVPSPKEIYEIGTGQRQGNRQAALGAFAELGEVLGDALANAITLLDGLVVIGGGLSAAYPLFIGAVLAEMNGTLESYSGKKFSRLIQRCFDLENEQERKLFLAGQVKTICVPRSRRTVPYDSMKRIGLGLSVLETSRAVSVGAYAFALSQMDSR